MWSVIFANAAVRAEIDALPYDMQVRLARVFTLVEASGFNSLPRGWVKHLEDKLWEFRITGRDGIVRAIYLTASGRRIAVLRVFVKKTQKTPPHEIELARQRARLVV